MGEIAGPLRGTAVEEVRLGLHPAAQDLARAPFPLVDLRRRAEEHPPFSGAAAFAADSRFMAQQYAAPIALKPDPLLRARDATLHGGGIWAGGQLVPGSVHRKLVETARQAEPLFARMRQTGRLPRLEGATALIHTPGFRNYFHWMTESLPRLEALAEYRRQGIGPLDRILIAQPDPKGFVEQSVALFFPDLLPLLHPVEKARFDLQDALFFLDWRGIAPVFTRIKTTTAQFLERVAAQVAALPRGGGGRALLVSRGDVDNRRLVNEDALLAAFAPFGLEAVRFTGMPVAEQMRLMAEARLVVGVHGAGLTNTMFCRPGTALLEITSTQYIRRSRSYADIATFRGLPYALAVVDQVGEDWVVQSNRGNDLEIATEALPELRRLAETLLAAPLAGAA
jgi:capsular polysaccharide biosynthesis protein